ncbi:translocation and assembly module TamB [Sphingobium wenxiniae]|uniref:Autotransporter secretion inner membrane protein TamB n=1 Tax=Sphingobium wenxiniae (strain DSM 21828 / CGMCC 1.7748 / JZ-1) TaxID=595605 RepID=A0A562K8H8_SPHWJ|nr:translocation/assembly module TamB domain-containing protein [Sphingobium wenxiniae]MBB6192509.1 translocation and assembly module TamB [Sphingobium wenxiniae]TWH91697.1 autotransporter secretion inner membrane protein TamB [Sphingobium wenxiniae]
MADDTPPPPARPGRPLWAKIAIGAAGLVVALAVLAVGLLLFLNTQPGKTFLIRQIAALKMESGMAIEVGRIDGSIYSDMVIHDLVLRDPKGVFAVSPQVHVVWRPFRYINNHISVQLLESPLVVLARSPQFNQTPTDPNAPILPDLDIDVDRMKLARFILAKPVIGQKREIAIDGVTHIADGRAQLSANAVVDSGDRLAASLDAVPAQNRLAMKGTLTAPKGGVIAAMTGLTDGVTATLDGKGTWQAWDGRLVATSPKGELANIALAARDGNFTAKGPLRPGLVFAGTVDRLTTPALDVDLFAGLNERRVNLKGTLRSPALAANAQGLIDLGKSRFSALKIDAALLTPGAIMEKVKGRDVRASVILDGPMATPFVDYDITAAMLAFDATGIEGLKASGRAVIDADRIRIPVSATARRVTGLNAAAGGLLENLRVKGDFAYAGGKLISDNLKINSNRIDATAIVLADLDNAIYRGALKGRVNDYKVDGVGIVNLTTDMELVPGPKGGFGLSGKFGVRTARWDNASVRDFLGGNAVASGRIGMTPEGKFTLAGLKGAAPNFRILSGSGSYDTDGAITFDTAAASKQYGPLTLAVRGTMERPQAVLRAARPNVGVQLRDVVAKLNGEAAGYRLEATGGSDYGPFFANVLIRTAQGPLTIDVTRARFAGVDMAGTLRQTQAGPFAGQLSLNGSGINGAIRLAAVGEAQGVDVNATASNAKLPGEADVVIGRALVSASLVMTDQPRILADVQMANAAYGDYIVRKARTRIDYQGGRGRAQLVADGSSGVPFSIAVNAALRPTLYAVAVQGKASNVDFRLAKPAIIRIEQGGYRLEPATLVLPQGKVDLAGRFGDRTALQARFKDFDLAIVNMFSPGIGIGGRATGTLDFAQEGNAFPIATTRLAISDFRRSSLTAVSDPVAMNVEGKLTAAGGDLRGVIRRGNASLGRFIATLAPPGPGASWSEQLMAAPLGGGIRYAGPADVLFSFAGLADQRLTGPIAVAADFGGRVNDPRINGLVRANALTYENETFGTRVTQMRLGGRFTNDRLEIRDFSGRAGDGTVQASGTVGLAADSGFPMNIAVKMDRARLARSEAITSVVSGTLAITNSAADGGLIKGDLSLPETRYRVAWQGGTDIRQLQGVRRKGEGTDILDQRIAARQAAAKPADWKLDIRVRADNEIYVTGMGLDSEWKTNMRVTGTTANPRVVGKIEVIRGRYSFSGHQFELEQGVITFEGEMMNPTLAIRAETKIDAVTAGIAVNGSAQRPDISFISNPTLPQDEILARILFGSNVANLSATQAVQLAVALNGLRGGSGGLNPLGKLQGASGLDRIGIVGGDEATGRGTSLAVGQHISNNVYVEVITDPKGFTATQLEIALSKTLSLLSKTGTNAGSSANLRYSKDY